MERKAVKIFTAQDSMQARMIMDTFNDNGIPAYKKDLGNSEIINLYGGYSRYGEDIFVADTDVEMAADILAVMGLEAEKPAESD